MDAVIAHSEHGAAPPARRGRPRPPDRVRVIPHGAFDYLTRLPEEKPLPAELAGAEGPVILFFGLLRPYKGIDTLLEAFRRGRGRRAVDRRQPAHGPRAAARGSRPRRRAASASSPASSTTPRSRRSSAAPTSSSCPTATPSTPASSTPASPSASRWCSSAVGGFPEVAARGRGADRPARGPGAARRGALRAGRRRRAPARELAAAAARAAARSATPGTRSPRRTLDALPGAAGRHADNRARARSRLLAPRRPDRLHPRRLPAGRCVLLLRLRRAGRAGHGATAGARAPAPRLADRRRLRRGGGDRRQGRQRARARLPARAARDRRRLRRLHRRAPPSSPAPPAPTSSSTCRAAARSPPRTPPPSAPTARSSPSPTPTASGSRDALRRLVEPFADPEVGYVCGQVRFPDPGGDNLEGAYWRYEMAVRELESRSAGSPPATGRSTRCAATPTCRCRPRAATTSPSPSSSPSAACARSTSPPRGPRRRWCPTLEGEFARKRRMMVGLWDIVVGEGMLSPARLPAALRLRDRLAPAAALPDPVPAPGRAGDQPRPARRGLGLRGHPRRPGGAARRRAARPRRCRWRRCGCARYYVLITASIAAGLWDRARRGAAGTWEKAEGTR